MPQPDHIPSAATKRFVCPRGHRHYEGSAFCTVCGAGPVLEAKPTLNEAVADESWIKAVAKRLLREHGETLRKLAEGD